MSFEIGVLSFIILVLCDSFVHIETNFFCILYASQECAKCWLFSLILIFFGVFQPIKSNGGLTVIYRSMVNFMALLICEWKTGILINNGFQSIYVYVKFTEQKITVIIALKKELKMFTMTFNVCVLTALKIYNDGILYLVISLSSCFAEHWYWMNFSDVSLYIKYIASNIQIVQRCYIKTIRTYILLSVNVNKE